MNRVLAVCSAVAASFLVSCQDDEIQVYQIAKDPASDGLVDRSAQAPVNAPFANMGAPAQSSSDQPAATTVKAEGEPANIVSWTLPQGWTELPATRMLNAKFQAGDAVVTISAFPGTVGGDLANVNRWRGQVGLAAISQAELDSLMTKESFGGKNFKYLTLAGGEQALDVAWLFDGAKTHFIKSSGTADAVAHERATFKQFLSQLVWK